MSALRTDIAVDVARDGVTVPLSEARIREIVRGVCRKLRVKNAMISVTFVSNRTIARMNRAYLKHQGPTDIITFELSPTGGVTMGDMYIAIDVARENARAHGVGVREELVRLVVHGTLHVLGHSHPDGNGRTESEMWKTQEKLVAAFI